MRIKACISLTVLAVVLTAASQAQVPATAGHQRKPPAMVEPVFLFPETAGVSDYRPVLNTDATAVVFERTIAGATELYAATLPGGTPAPFTGVSGSERADWCWLRSGGTLTNGPLAFSAENGVYVMLNTTATATLLPNTEGMIYPAWFPDCGSLAVDGGSSHVTSVIDAKTGKILVPQVGDYSVSAGFASVNQANPNLISIAGQFNRDSNYYNQDLNYTWVAHGSKGRARVEPMDRHAPKGSGFIQLYQARAGWWSPDGKWFAFELNRSCDNMDGNTYAIFIQDLSGKDPAMQVTNCHWNAQHPKWFPPGSNGGRTMLIAAVAVATPSGNGPFRIASLDVSAFVAGK